ncbi:MAG: acyl-CoA desaturase [Planctomycetaceae bacterium]
MSNMLQSPPSDLPEQLVPSVSPEAGCHEVTEKYVATREQILASFSPENLKWSNVSWHVVAWMALIHVGAVAALFFFTWQAVAVALVLHWFTCSIGICLTYHRALSHRSFKLHGPAKVLGLYAAAVCAEGSPLRWSMVHRIHHSHSDEPGDPHSPLEGPWWSHLLWMFVHQDAALEKSAYDQYVPDLQKDKTVMFFERFWFVIMLATAAGLYAWGGLSMFLWAVCFRMTLAYHSTWFVNSATHLWGYRNYQTTDESRNLWWVAILSYGEGWHNNHHAHPRIARAGHRWFEFDPTWQAIKLLRSVGLATEVVDRLPSRG